MRRHLQRRALQAWDQGTIAFVCLGNICRSPFAERLVHQGLGNGRRVESAGTFPEEGRRSPRLAIEAAYRHDVDLTPHRSRVLTQELVEEADAIFVFDQDNHRAVVRTYPSAKGSVHFIGALAEEGALLVPDPFGGTEEDYEITYRRIAELIARANASAARLGPGRGGTR